MNRELYLTAAILWAFLIAFFSLSPASAVEGYIDFPKSWIYHVMGYFILALLLQRTDLLRNRYVIPLVILYGSVIEVMQNFVPGRYSDLWDIAANSAGAFGGGVPLNMKFFKTAKEKITHEG